MRGRLLYLCVGEPDPGVGGRGEGLDSPGGRIGVSLLTGAKFGDRIKKYFRSFLCLIL